MGFRPAIKEIIIITNELTLIKSANFGEIQADIYSKDDEMYMTTEQLGRCLGYSQPKAAISKIINRNEYLKNEEFSGVTKMTTPDGGTQDTRVFTEDGIYEITFLAKTEKAKEFRSWVRTLLKSLRTGELKLSQDNVVFSPDIIEAIIQKYLPRLNPLTLNTWKKYVAKPLVSSIQEQANLESKESYEFVYSQMTEKFGFNSAFAIMQFRDKYFVDTVSIIDTIAENPVYQQQFVMAANNILERLSAFALVDAPQRKKFTIEDSVDTIISELADLYNDSTQTHLSIYKLIYNKMNTARGWKYAMSRHHKYTKKSLIESNPNYKKRFVDVCNDILLENNK